MRHDVNYTRKHSLQYILVYELVVVFDRTNLLDIEIASCDVLITFLDNTGRV